MIYVTVQMTKSGKNIDHDMNKSEQSMLKEDSLMGDSVVKYSIGMTINLGNYSGAKVDVGVEIPAQSDNLDAGYEIAQEYCNDKLMDEVTHLQKLKGKL